VAAAPRRVPATGKPGAGRRNPADPATGQKTGQKQKKKREEEARKRSEKKKREEEAARSAAGTQQPPEPVHNLFVALPVAFFRG